MMVFLNSVQITKILSIKKTTIEGTVVLGEGSSIQYLVFSI
jgi:hypothetical protein